MSKTVALMFVLLMMVGTIGMLVDAFLKPSDEVEIPQNRIIKYKLTESQIKELLKNYAKDGGKLGLHPDKGSLPGIEVSTGSLGHGLSVGVGLSLAAKINKLSYKTFVIIGDGECNEGSIWEAAIFASQQKLDNMVVILDYNHLQGFGRTEEVINLEPLVGKWQAFGWSVKQIDGHNFKEIIEAFEQIPFKKNKPNIIIANTIKGKGVSFLEDKLESHYKKINQGELRIALKELK